MRGAGVGPVWATRWARTPRGSCRSCPARRGVRPGCAAVTSAPAPTPARGWRPTARRPGPGRRARHPRRRRRGDRRGVRRVEGRHRDGQRGALHRGPRWPPWSCSTRPARRCTRRPASCTAPASAGRRVRPAPATRPGRAGRRPRRRPAAQRARGTAAGHHAVAARHRRGADQGAVHAARRDGADGLARGVRPVHTMVDGDTTFALSTVSRPAPGAGRAATSCSPPAPTAWTRAIVHAMLAAESVRTSAGNWPAYPAALPTRRPGLMPSPAIADSSG